MSCPRCRSESTLKRGYRTSLGCRIYYCRNCRRRFNERTGTPYNHLQIPEDIELMAVLWRLRYKLGLRDVAELLLQRGFEISHESIRAWEYQFAPLVSKNLRSKRRGKIGRSWYLDETSVKVSGRWCYLYRAIDRDGNLLDSMLSDKRDKHAARRFLRRLLESAEQKPQRVTTDKHPAYSKAVRWIIGRKVTHRHSQYLNNRIEQDHRHIKQRYYPMLGFKQFDSASRFCTAFDELRNYLKVRTTVGEQVSAADRRQIFSDKWTALMVELAA